MKWRVNGGLIDTESILHEMGTFPQSHVGGCVLFKHLGNCAEGEIVENVCINSKRAVGK